MSPWHSESQYTISETKDLQHRQRGQAGSTAGKLGQCISRESTRVIHSPLNLSGNAYKRSYCQRWANASIPISFFLIDQGIK